MSPQELEVRQVLQAIIPAMEADGGGIKSIFVQGDVVALKLKGTCLFCPSIDLTMRFGITPILKENLPWIKEVVKMK